MEEMSKTYFMNVIRFRKKNTDKLHKIKVMISWIAPCHPFTIYYCLLPAFWREYVWTLSSFFSICWLSKRE